MANFDFNKYLKYKELDVYISKIDRQIEMYKEIKKDLFDYYGVSSQSLYEHRMRYGDINIEDKLSVSDFEYILKVNKGLGNE